MNNVFESEVEKFTAMANEWWDPKGPCRPLHELNPLRLGFIQTHCELKNRVILDLGCGGGILTESLSQYSPHVIGLDQSQEALNVAQIHAQPLSSPPEYRHDTAENFAITHPEQFDLITCMEMLEHVPSPTSILAACAQLLKPGGDLVVSTLNRTPKSFMQAIIGAEYVLKLLPKGTHSYDQFIRPSELATWARQHDLQLKSMKGIQYHLLSKSFSLSDDVGVNYMMHLQKASS